MPYQKVIVKINKKNGTLTIEGDGFVGTQCDVLSELEQKLGTITYSEDKPERYQQVLPDVVPNRIC